jgi:hypothetical protein
MACRAGGGVRSDRHKYIVVGAQYWLDGTNAGDNFMRQFGVGWSAVPVARIAANAPMLAPRKFSR